jgi:hypothetical protein
MPSITVLLAERVVVVTCTVRDAGSRPETDAGLGATPQVAPLGAPLHIIVTAPLKPVVGVTFNL